MWWCCQSNGNFSPLFGPFEMKGQRIDEGAIVQTA
jgi:hypothetical protein